MAIPKIFHQIWINKDSPSLPEKYVTYRDSWIKKHPGWDYVLWNLDNLDFVPCRPDLLSQAKNYAQMADILRYEILYRHGGVYIDTDFECYRNIESIVEGVDNFSCSEDGSSISIGIIGASKNSLYMRRCMNALPECVGLRNTAEETGPALFTRVLLKEGIGNDLVIFPTSYFYPYSWTEMGLANTEFPDAYAAHHWAHSWGGDTFKVRLRRRLLKMIDLILRKL